MQNCFFSFKDNPFLHISFIWGPFSLLNQKKILVQSKKMDPKLEFFSIWGLFFAIWGIFTWFKELLHFYQK